MTSVETPLLAATLLRCTVGGFMVPHGLQKFGLIGGDRGAETRGFDALGLRPGAAWSALAGAAQVGFGLLLVLGLLTPLAAAGTVVFMLTAAAVGVRRNGWYWHDHGMEYAIFWALAAAAVALLGAGPWSLDHALGLGAPTAG